MMLMNKIVERKAEQMTRFGIAPLTPSKKQLLSRNKIIFLKLPNEQVSVNALMLSVGLDWSVISI